MATVMAEAHYAVSVTFPHPKDYTDVRASNMRRKRAVFIKLMDVKGDLGVIRDFDIAIYEYKAWAKCDPGLLPVD